MKSRQVSMLESGVGFRRGRVSFSLSNRERGFDSRRQLHYLVNSHSVARFKIQRLERQGKFASSTSCHASLHLSNLSRSSRVGSDVVSSRQVRGTAVVLTLAASMFMAGCSHTTTSTESNRSLRSFEPMTRQFLLRVAGLFNSDYSTNRVGAVYDRWDANSRSIISRTDYIRRHTECPTSPGAATVEGASPGANGFWGVRYSISGVQFVDYWHYVNGKWRFNLALSNPSAVNLYRLTFAAYAAAVGCRL